MDGMGWDVELLSQEPKDWIRRNWHRVGERTGHWEWANHGKIRDGHRF